MRKNQDSQTRQTTRHSLVSLISALLVIFLLAGCSPTPRLIEYQNKETGIWFQMPGNWSAEYVDRNGTIYVSGRRAAVPDDATRLTISAGHCLTGPASTPISMEALSEMVREDIERIGRLYELETVEIVEEPTRVEGKYSEGIRAVVQVPTSAMGKASEGTKETPAGDPAPETFQIIEVNAINYNQNIIWIHVYPGSDERLNDKAREIVRTVWRVCEPEGE